MSFCEVMETAFHLAAVKLFLPNFIRVHPPWHVVWLLLVICLIPVCTGEGVVPGCHIPTLETGGLSRAGDVLIGAVFPLHVDRINSQISFEEDPLPATCQTFVFQNYQWLLAMEFAIEEINRNPDLLPNVTLGFQIYDSCADPLRALQGSLWMLTGQEKSILNYRCQRSNPLGGIIGDAASRCSIPIARVLGMYRHPQVSYFSTIPLLNDRNEFPSFFRTIPSDDYQFHGLAQLVMHFSWSWVGVLAADDDYGQNGAQILKAELHKAGACVAFTEKIILAKADRNAKQIVQVIKKSTANAIVIFCLDSRLVPVLNELVKQNITGKIFIASEAWSMSALLPVPKYLEILSGTIGFAIRSGEMPGFKQFLNNVHPSNVANDNYMSIFWETAFHCKLSDHKWLSNNQTAWCTGAERLDSVSGIYNDVTSPRVTYNVYRAVYAISLALHDLNTCLPTRGPFRQGACAISSEFQSWQLLHYMKSLQSWDTNETKPFFDSSGNPRSEYDIVNWKLGADGAIQQGTVGHYDSSAPTGNTLLINTSAIWWPGAAQVPVSVCSSLCPKGFRQVAKDGEASCCFLCVACPQGEITIEGNSAECVKCPWDQWPSIEHDRCLLKPLSFLSYEEPLGSIMAVVTIILAVIPAAILTLFIYSSGTPIVKANNRSLSYLLLLSLVMCFLCSFTFIGFPTPVNCLLRQAAFGITFALCVSCILAKTIIVVIAFNSTKPNSEVRRWVGPKLSYLFISVCTLIQVVLCVIWLVLSPPFLQYNSHTQPEIIIVECNEGHPIAFWCMLGYLGLLAAVNFIVAFLARKLPDSFNEARFITFSMLAFLSVWISFIPAYLSTRGKYMVAMEIFAILSSSLALVSCIFFPKCYIILLRPKMNTKRYLMGRD